MSALALAALAIDHLIGTAGERDNGDDFPIAPAAFVISAAVTLVLAVFLFRVIVRRAAGETADRAPRKAITCAVLALAAVPLLFLGLPFPLAGAAIALGLHGRAAIRPGAATAAIVIGGIVLGLCSLAYAVTLVS